MQCAIVTSSPGNRLTAALIDLRPTHDSDLLVIANHWSCCTADAARQRQADALIAFLRDARTPGGVLDLAPGTPIVAGGDFNLVGWRRQLETLLTGDIVDNATWGPDSPPDWDGSSFDEIDPRHTGARLTYTWRNDFGSFYPGKLDWFVVTGSVTRVGAHFVLDTRSMTPASLAQYGLQPGDSELASDHGPVVGDVAPFSSVDVAGGGAAPGLRPAIALGPLWPNPLRGKTTIAFELPGVAPIDLRVFDAAGREVRTLLSGVVLASGSHVAEWDGRDDAGRIVAPGTYWYRVKSGSLVATRRAVVVR